VTEWFDLGGNLQIDDTLPAGELLARTDQVAGLHDAARSIAGKKPSEPLLASAVDFVLEGLYAQRKISRSTEGQFQAAEPMKPRVTRQMEPIADHELPLGNKKKYYN